MWIEVGITGVEGSYGALRPGAWRPHVFIRSFRGTMNDLTVMFENLWGAKITLGEFLASFSPNSRTAEPHTVEYFETVSGTWQVLAACRRFQ